MQSKLRWARSPAFTPLSVALHIRAKVPVLAESLAGPAHPQASGKKKPEARLPELLTGVFNA